MSERDEPWSGTPMDLFLALDFAASPRRDDALQAPADSKSELREALRVVAASYRGAEARAQDAERQLAEERARVEALEAVLREADYVTNSLAASRRPHGYVITSIAKMDGHLEGYLKYRAKTAG